MNLPPITKSLRFRLSGTTTAVVFGVATVALGVVYMSLLIEVRSLTRLALTQRLTERGIEFATREIRTMESFFQERLLNVVAGVMLVLLVVLFLTSLVVGWVLAGRALAPLDRIVAVANEIEATDLSRRIGRTGTNDELERFAGTFDAMLDRLDTAFQQQRRFLAQTSHDLRTPLAIIRSHLDVTMSDPEASEEDWKAAGEIALRASERMSVMIDDLLVAARLELPGTSMTLVDLADLVMDAASDIHAAAAGASVHVEVAPNPAPINGDRQALDRAIGNLVDNALRVSPEGGELKLASGVVNRCAFVSISDRGPGIDRSLLRGEKRKRGGLGLEIVRLIVSSHRGWIDGEDRPGGGTRVVMWFPSADRSGELVTDPPALADLPA